jgi:hAT family C-terminal dimerisation region
VKENVFIDPIQWWKNKNDLYLNLSKMALDYHVIMASNVLTKQAFSKSGDLI